MTQFSTLYGARLDEELASADSTVLFTTARRKSAINRGAEDFARLTKCFVRVAHSTVVSSNLGELNLLDSTAFSTLAAGDFVELAIDPPEFRYTDGSGNLTIQTGEDFPRRDFAWLQRYIPNWGTSTVAAGTEQRPQVWYLRSVAGSVIFGMWPVPSSGSSAVMAVKIPYIARPAVMTSDTAEPFTVSTGVRLDLRPVHQALVHYGAHQLEKLRRDEQASQSQYQKYLLYVTQWLQDNRRKGGSLITFLRDWRVTRPASWWQGDPRR